MSIEHVVKHGQPLAMLRAHLDGLPQPQLIHALQALQPVSLHAFLRLVGDEHHGQHLLVLCAVCSRDESVVLLAYHARVLHVVVGERLTSVDEEQSDVAVADGATSQLLDGVLQRDGRMLLVHELGRGRRLGEEGLHGLEAGRVDKCEAQRGECGCVVQRVSCDARCAVSDGYVAADEAVEESGLADVRTAEDGYTTLLSGRVRQRAGRCIACNTPLLRR